MENKKLNVNKASLMVIGLNIVQIVIILIALCYILIFKKPAQETSIEAIIVLLFFIVVIVLVNSFIMIRDRIMLSKVDKQYEIIRTTISQVETLNNTLRAQRHDFLNHLQVVYSLMELEEYKSATDYIKNVYKDIQEVSRFLRTTSPAINALLQAKILNAENKYIRMQVKVSSQLKDLGIEEWELCRILGNLIDNAIYAVKDKKGSKNIKIEINEDLKYHKFRVIDNGPPIDGSILSKIFEVGFTTKGEHGDGMGLAIIKDILKESDGHIDVGRIANETVFEVALPRLIDANVQKL